METGFEVLRIAVYSLGTYVEVDGWKVLYTGWKNSPLSIDTVHQWVLRAPDDRWENRVFCTSMPGRKLQMLNPGDRVMPDAEWNQIGFAADLSSLGRYRAGAVMSTAVTVTACVVWAVMSGAIEYVDGAFQLKWEALGRELQFYLDPNRYINEAYGVRMEDVLGLRLALKAALYEGADWPGVETSEGK